MGRGGGTQSADEHVGVPGAALGPRDVGTADAVDRDAGRESDVGWDEVDLTGAVDRTPGGVQSHRLDRGLVHSGVVREHQVAAAGGVGRDGRVARVGDRRVEAAPAEHAARAGDVRAVEIVIGAGELVLPHDDRAARAVGAERRVGLSHRIDADRGAIDWPAARDRARGGDALRVDVAPHRIGTEVGPRDDHPAGAVGDDLGTRLLVRRHAHGNSGRRPCRIDGPVRAHVLGVDVEAPAPRVLVDHERPAGTVGDARGRGLDLRAGRDRRVQDRAGGPRRTGRGRDEQDGEQRERGQRDSRESGHGGLQAGLAMGVAAAGRPHPRQCRRRGFRTAVVAFGLRSDRQAVSERLPRRGMPMPPAAPGSDRGRPCGACGAYRASTSFAIRAPSRVWSRTK